MNRASNIIIGTGIVVLILQTLVFALIPPPPANQLLGVYDTNFVNLTGNNCRVCHTSGVPDRHHMLLPSGEYQCVNCHPLITNPDGSLNILIIRDCMRCHGTTFNNISVPVPHHETEAAQNRHCSFCHGNIVDDFDDGHYIPAYNISVVTPDTKYKEINASTGRKWGGCEACHERDDASIPPIYFNNKTHHRLGSLSGFYPPNNSKCLTCHELHNGQFGSDSVRYCERCHAVKSLHNIQYNYSGTIGKPGWGHIGAEWDCKGCHAWYVAGSMAPGTDVVVPSITALSTGSLHEGETAVLTINGTDFMTNIGYITQSSVALITDGTNTISITPGSFTSSGMVVTIPALKRGAYGIYALKNGIAKSNKFPLTVAPDVTIDSAVKNSTKLVISGSGFGSFDPEYMSLINVTIAGRKGNKVMHRAIVVNAWSDTLIEVTGSDTEAGDIATVNSVYGTVSAKVTYDTTAAPTPKKTPDTNKTRG